MQQITFSILRLYISNFLDAEGPETKSETDLQKWQCLSLHGLATVISNDYEIMSDTQLYHQTSIILLDCLNNVQELVQECSGRDRYI